MLALVAAVSYLLGSLTAGVLYSRLRGDDIRNRDLPGGSGTFRQYGRSAAVLVTALDILKGVLAALLARWLVPEYTWLATLAVVLGHCYPLYFKFNGGGGIAPLLGAMLAVAPRTLLFILLLAAVIIPLYKVTLQSRLKLNAVPFATPIVVLAGLWFASRYGGLSDLLAGGAAMALRAVHLLAFPPVSPAKNS